MYFRVSLKLVKSLYGRRTYEVKMRACHASVPDSDQVMMAAVTDYVVVPLHLKAEIHKRCKSVSYTQCHKFVAIREI